MIVYGSSLSPFVRKVLAVGIEKGLPLELKSGGMGFGGPEFEEASPFRKMPALRDAGADDGRDFVISDSTAIVVYLDAKHPETPMLPADPIHRARTTWYEEFADTILVPAAGKLFFNRFVAPFALKQSGDEAAAAHAETVELPPILDYLERTVPADGFLVGETITLADIAVASPFVNLAHVGTQVDAARWPRTAAYLARIHARPSFADAIVSEQRMVAAMSS